MGNIIEGKKVEHKIEKQIEVDLSECPKLKGYYCSKDPRNCATLIREGYCYECDDAVWKAAYNRKLKVKNNISI